ncbi:hypothetical protein ABZ829_35840 [Streptomyces xanthochromogenes]|uniref:hypothetical protein n=1 Tax=Streptomyces xanthochromogenes TaxID=67384 RepID=UPI0034440ADA
MVLEVSGQQGRIVRDEAHPRAGPGPLPRPPARLDRLLRNHRAALDAGKNATEAGRAAQQALASATEKRNQEQCIAVQSARKQAEENASINYRTQDDPKNDHTSQFPSHSDAGIPSGVRNVVGFFSLRGFFDGGGLFALGRTGESKESFKGFIGPFIAGQSSGYAISGGQKVGLVVGPGGTVGAKIFGWPVAFGATIVDYLLPEGGPVRYLEPGPLGHRPKPPIASNHCHHAHKILARLNQIRKVHQGIHQFRQRPASWLEDAAPQLRRSLCGFFWHRQSPPQLQRHRAAAVAGARDRFFCAGHSVLQIHEEREQVELVGTPTSAGFRATICVQRLVTTAVRIRVAGCQKMDTA